MIIYSGKAINLTFKMLLWIAFWELSRPIELLEASNFSKN